MGGGGRADEGDDTGVEDVQHLLVGDLGVDEVYAGEDFAVRPGDGEGRAADEGEGKVPARCEEGCWGRGERGAGEG